LPSFRRKPEASSLDQLQNIWPPAFAGVTTFCECIILEQTKNPPGKRGIFLFNGLLTGTIIWCNYGFREVNMPMAVKFSENIVPLRDLKVNPGRIVHHVDATHRPVLLTSRGRGFAVMQSLSDYEAGSEERAFMKAVLQGLADIEEDRTVSLADAKKRLGLV
jgi:prevent-host-death family protein